MAVKRKKVSSSVERGIFEQSIAKQNILQGEIVIPAKEAFGFSRFCKNGFDADVIACIAHAMLEKKGERVVSMDLKEIPGASFDFFVICDGSSGPQVRAIADEIEEKVYEQFGISALHVEGYANAEWILMDFGGVLAHVFLDSVRQHYRLEELWGDASTHFYNDND